MKVVFVLYGTKGDEATMMVESCKWHGYEVIQLSDEVAPVIQGVDQVIRAPMDKARPELWRYQRLSEVEPPFVSLDTDVIVVKDISDGFDPDFDACLTERPANDMPFNSGVFFVQSQRFIEECVRRIWAMDKESQAWFGGQLAMADILNAGGLKIKSLPCEEWNNSHSVRVGSYKGARVLHFKGGKRKHMNLMFEERKACRS